MEDDYYEELSYEDECNEEYEEFLTDENLEL